MPKWETWVVIPSSAQPREGPYVRRYSVYRSEGQSIAQAARLFPNYCSADVRTSSGPSESFAFVGMTSLTTTAVLPGLPDTSSSAEIPRRVGKSTRLRDDIATRHEETQRYDPLWTCRGDTFKGG